MRTLSTLAAACALTCTLLIPVSSTVTAQTRGSNIIPVQDPTLGVMQGNLPLLPGWRGEAHIDRTSDPLAWAIGTLAADLSSGDGSTKIQMLGVPFHTYGVNQQMGMLLPGSPTRQKNAAMVRFTSTAQLLKQNILPVLQITGQTVETQSMSEATRAQLLAQSRVPGPIFDTAYTLLRRGNEDVVVYGITFGSGAGTANEVTSTVILICTAPQGRALPAIEAQQALQPVQRSPDWQRADERYVAAWREMIAEEGRRGREITDRQTASILAQGHANVAAMQARGAARDRAFVEHEQLTSDLGANFRGYLSGTSASFKWCGGTGGPMYTVDDVRPPAQGMRRCE